MKVDILGVKVDALNFEQTLKQVDDFLLSNGQKQIITANPEIVLEAWQNEAYRNLINNAALVLPDGIGLLWAAKFLSLKSEYLLTSIIQMMVSGASLVFSPEYCKKVLPARIAGVDLMEKICEQAARKNWKIYLLGGQQGVAEKTAVVLKNKYLNLQIVGAEEGMINYEIGNKPDDALLDRIKQAQPEIILVAFGAPQQDFFIQQILQQLSSIKLAMGVGGAFDFISGQVKRAPVIYQDLGLEWLWRLFTEPWRFIRIFNATIRFIISVVRYKHLLK